MNYLDVELLRLHADRALTQEATRRPHPPPSPQTRFVPTARTPWAILLVVAIPSAGSWLG